MIPHGWRWPHAPALLQGFGDLHGFGGEVQVQLRVRNSLKPVDGAFVVRWIQILNRRTLNRRGSYWRMNVDLLERMVVFVAARLVNMKKRGFDESA